MFYFINAWLLLKLTPKTQLSKFVWIPTTDMYTLRTLSAQLRFYLQFYL
jgi:hypothetical protein